MSAVFCFLLLLTPSLAILCVAGTVGLHSRLMATVSWVLGPVAWAYLAIALRALGLAPDASRIAALVFCLAGIAIAASLSRCRSAARNAIFRAGSLRRVLPFAIPLLPLLIFVAAKGGAMYAWDSQYHARLATYLERATIPPGNPFLAGSGLAYPWHYDFLVGLLARTSGLSPYEVFPIVNLHALIGLVLAISLCMRSVGRSSRMAWIPVFLAIWAPNALGWLVFVARLLTGRAAGATAIGEAASNFDVVLSQMAPGYARFLAFPAHKFLEGTPFCVILPFPFLLIAIGSRMFREGETRDGAALPPPFLSILAVSLLIAAWIHLHFMSALLLLPALGIAAWIGAGWPKPVSRAPAGGREARRILVISYAVGLAASAPYLWVTLGKSVGGGGWRLLGFGPRAENLLGLAVVGLPYLAAAALATPDRPLPRIVAFRIDPTERNGMASALRRGTRNRGSDPCLTDHNEEKVLIPAAMLAPLVAWPAIEKGLKAASALVRTLTWSFVGSSVFGVFVLVAFACAWDPRPQYRDDGAVARAIERAVPSSAVLVSDVFAPMPQTRAAYLLFPELQGLWGHVAELRERQGVIEALKGSSLRRPLGLGVTRSGRWPEPVAFSMEGALAELRQLPGGAVLVAPAGKWKVMREVDRAGSLQRLETPEWDVIVIPPQ
ncbi:MAG: hypothetical protein QUU85_16085 [Candidatus Eisenbacteria bacterium]|nr:hypothetical protein [Candidatus Eisenbacteria bacterium]